MSLSTGYFVANYMGKGGCFKAVLVELVRWKSSKLLTLKLQGSA